MEPDRRTEADRHDGATIIDDILHAFMHRLLLQDNALAQDPANADEVRRQVGFIIEDVILRTDASIAPSMGTVPEARLFSVEVGAKRARAGIHPSESLRAATLLFQVALPILATRYDGDSARVVSVGAALHEALMDRIVLASLSYVDTLIDKVRASRQAERRHIARELHDRVAHGMGLALQHLDLHQHYAESDPQRARIKLNTAMASLTEALRTVQQLSAELRRSTAEAGIERAMQAYLANNVPAEVQASLRITGDAKPLPPNITEELYLILREATRNALRHADPSSIEITVDVDDRSVVAVVRDDGRGFDPVLAVHGHSGGLPSMTERAELMHGTIALVSAAGTGTTVTLRVPLGGNTL